MVITRHCAAKHNIKLQKGLQYNKKNKPQNNELHYVFKFLLFIMIFTTSTIAYHYIFEDNKTLYNFIITDLPEKTIVNLYNKIPARPYNYILDMIQDYNINYF